MKMNTKKLLVSFMAIASFLFLMASVSAGYNITDVEIDNQVVIDENTLPVGDINDISLVAGDTVSVEVWFTSDDYDEDVTVQVELENGKEDASVESTPFDVRPDKEYHKRLTIRVPFDLKDDLFDDLTLTVEINGADFDEELRYVLEVERPSFNADIKSIVVSNSVEAGETFPVDVVLKNTGYNDLDDLFITVGIPALGIEQSSFLGDIVALECDDSDDDVATNFPWGENTLDRKCNEDDEDTIRGRLNLEVPFGVPAGIYTIEVTVGNEDTVSTAAKQISVENAFETNVFVSGNSLWVVNPTNNVLGYRIVAESPASVSENIVFVPAGSSKTITVDPNAEGEYSFDVNVFTMNGNLVQTLTFSGADGEDSTTSVSNPVVVLTVILAIVFLVLLVVLIVLLGKKPSEKSEEFGESYY